MGQRRVSIKEIAQLTNLSVATVSRVINNKGSYSKRAEELVNRVVKKYHYIPNLVARNLKTNSSTAIGLIIPDIYGDFFSRMVLEIQIGLFQRGYTVLILNTNHDAELAEKSMSAFYANQVCGIINFVGKTLTSQLETWVPTVYLDRIPEGFEERAKQGKAISVTGNNRMGGYLAGKELLKKGCKTIWVLTPRKLYSNHKERIEGFQQAMDEAGNIGQKVMIISVNGYRVEDGCESLMEVLKTEKPDGIFTINDYLANSCLMLMSKGKLKVPNQTKIIGFDVNQLLTYMTPSFTSVNQSVEKMAKATIQGMISMLEGKNGKKRYSIPVTIKQGQTS